MYLKITNAEENHHSLQYHDGLNIDPVPFAKEGSCCAGGIYFTTPEYICNFLHIGRYVREVTIPEDAEMVQDPEGDKWRASKVILSPRKDLNDIKTWKWFVENGLDIPKCERIIIYAFSNYYYLSFEMAKYLIECGININSVLVCSSVSMNGQIKIVKHLVENGADIHCDIECAMRCASNNGCFEVVKYLVENGADIHVYNDEALRLASRNGHIEVVKYLIENGADIHANEDEALRWASNWGHLNIVKILEQNG